MRYGEEFSVKPNYKVDDNGIPVSHAPGNQGDIEVYSERLHWLIEVTLIKSKIQQLNNETINLIRHLNMEEKYSETYLSLVAPVIHIDTQRLLNSATISLIFEGNLNSVNSKAYTTDDFIETLMGESIFDDMKESTRAFKYMLRENL